MAIENMAEALRACETLPEPLRYMARNHPGKIAFRFEGRQTSYGAFDRLSNRAANAMAAEGVGRGDRVAHLGKNTDFYFEALYGAIKIGAVMTPVNWRLAGPEIVFVVNDCEAKILFVGPEFISAIAAIRSQLTTVKTIVAMEGGAADWPSYEAWRDAEPDSAPDVVIAPQDIAIQLYTSGTTGNPKGAMLTNANFFGLRQAAGDVTPEWNRWDDDDIGLAAMPNFHIGGSGFGMSILNNGATGVIAREFAPAAALDFIEKDGVSKSFLVPAALQIIVRHPRARMVDYSRIRHIFYGASPIPLDLLRECMDVFKCGFVQMYGMTETTGTIVALGPEDHDPAGSPRMRSAGKPLPGVEVKIVDAMGETLPANEVGEIAVRSSSTMAGYWRLPEATQRTIAPDGWLRTGDAGYLDADGYVYIHDRVKDMIVSGAENIYPAEVENAIFGHPDVSDVAVIGVPDDKWGEAVKAFVVMKPGKDLDEDSIQTWVRARIAAYKAPKSIEAIAELPRNPSGKILRRQLREPYWAGRERRVN